MRHPEDDSPGYRPTPTFRLGGTAYQYTGQERWDMHPVVRCDAVFETSQVALYESMMATRFFSRPSVRQEHYEEMVSLLDGLVAIIDDIVDPTEKLAAIARARHHFRQNAAH